MPPLPEGPAPAETVISQLIEKAERGLMMATGPRFFGWVIGASQSALHGAGAR